MAIVRSRRASHFTVIDNALLADMSMSWAAKGVLVYLLSKPDDWSVSPAQLVKAGPAGKHAIYTVLAELEASGYARKAIARSEAGKFEGYDWVIYDYPYTEIQDTAERVEASRVKNVLDQQVSPCAENQDTAPGQPYPDSPYPDNPYPENQTLLNTDHTKPPPANARAREAGDEIPGPLPPTWWPVQTTIEACRMRGLPPPLPEHVAAFVGHYVDRHETPARWEGLFLKWMANQKVYDAERGARAASFSRPPTGGSHARQDGKRDFQEGASDPSRFDWAGSDPGGA